jgi:hypothetical protein
MTMALSRFRAGNFISLQGDYDDEPGQEDTLVPEYY